MSKGPSSVRQHGGDGEKQIKIFSNLFFYLELVDSAILLCAALFGVYSMDIGTHIAFFIDGIRIYYIL